MRLTNRVSRGLGTIRQDLNISIMNGPVIEVKGIQKLDQLSKVTNYEMCRQTGLIKLSKIIRDKNEIINHLRHFVLKEGDIIITSPLTFAASVNCIMYSSAIVDFVNIEQTNTIDVNEIEK